MACGAKLISSSLRFRSMRRTARGDPPGGQREPPRENERYRAATPDERSRLIESGPGGETSTS